jgi:hypothetical protein
MLTPLSQFSLDLWRLKNFEGEFETMPWASMYHGTPG